MDIINNKLSDKLLNHILGFKSHANKYLERDFHNDIYLLLGTLGGFLRDSILQDEESSMVKDSFYVLNEIYDEFDKAINETTFEMLTDYKRTITVSKEKLKGNALKGFEKVINTSPFNGGKHAK
jgi:hypothetical protein